MILGVGIFVWVFFFCRWKGGGDNEFSLGHLKLEMVSSTYKWQFQFLIFMGVISALTKMFHKLPSI